MPTDVTQFAQIIDEHINSKFTDFRKDIIAFIKNYKVGPEQIKPGAVIIPKLSPSVDYHIESTMAPALAELAETKTTIFYQTTAPSSPTLGDVWYDTDAIPVVIYRWDGEAWGDITSEALSSALAAAGDAQATADGKIVTFAQTEAPTATAIGDLWVDTNDNNKLYRWDGTAWTSVQDGLIASQAAAISDLASSVDSKTTIFYQTTAPTSPSASDIWYDTDSSPVVIYRWTGSAWDDITTSALSSALAAANTAQAIADGKIRSFAQVEAPAGMVESDVGDLWVDTDDNNKLYRWTGSTWDAVQDTHNDSILLSHATTLSTLSNVVSSKITTFYQPGVPTTTVVGDLWIDTDNGNMLCRWDGTVWIAVDNSKLQEALTAAGDAQATADGKIVTFARTSAPTATSSGDLWIDTDDNNKLYRWNGSSWVSVQDGLIASHSIIISTLTSSLNSKTTIYYQTSQPTATATGDVWYDTDASPVKIYRWSGSSWVDITTTALSQALAAAGTAQATADGKVRTFAQTTAPTGMVAGDVGDLWIDTNDNNKLYRWSSTAWVSVQDGTIALKLDKDASIGVRQFAPNSAWTRDTTKWTLATNVTRDETVRLDYAYSVKSVQSGLSSDSYRGARLVYSEGIPIAQGSVFTVSVWVRTNDALSIDAGIGLDADVYSSSGTRLEWGSCDYTPVTADNGKWVKINATFTATSSSAAYATIYFWVRRNGTAWFACPKLEKGEVATDWCTAPNELVIGDSVFMDQDGVVDVQASSYSVNVSGENGDISLNEYGLSVNQINSPSVQPQYTGASTIYVDKAATDAQVEAGTHHRSIKEAFAALSGKSLPYDMVLSVSAGTYYDGTISLCGVTGTGEVVIFGNSGVYLKSTDIDIRECSASIAISGLNIGQSATDNFGIYISTCSHVRINSCTLTAMTGSSTSVAAISARYGSHVVVTNCTIYGDWEAIQSRDSSIVYSINNIGDARLSVSQGQMIVEGTQPCDLTTFTYTRSTGGVLTQAGTVTVNQGTAATPPAATATATFAASMTRTVYGSSSWPSTWKSITNEIWQGYTSGSKYQVALFWFSGLSSISGKTILSAKLRIRRVPGIGKGDSVKLIGYYGNLAYNAGNGSPTSRVSMGTIGNIAESNSLKDFTIPIAAVSYLALSSTGRCIALNPGDSSTLSGKVYSSNYAKFSGIGSSYVPELVVTYQP